MLPPPAARKANSPGAGESESRRRSISDATTRPLSGSAPEAARLPAATARIPFCPLLIDVLFLNCTCVKVL